MPTDNGQRPATTRPAPKYPKGVNFQISADMARELDAIALLTGMSRADVIRACISKSAELVAFEAGLVRSPRGVWARGPRLTNRLHRSLRGKSGGSA